MKNLYNPKDTAEIISRIETLRADSPRLWGTMTAAQMLAHCTIGMEVVLGRQKPPRLLIGRLLTPFLKKTYYSEEPFRKNSPTAEIFIVSDEREFEGEKEKLKSSIHEFADGGPSKCTTHPHAFFGSFTPDQWSISSYKHLDHHLRQFGV